MQLNDAALTFEAETSAALGFGFRCGFLGLLHMEIVQERIEREFGLNIIATAPSVVYRITQTDQAEILIDNPALFPPVAKIGKIAEPYVTATIMLPEQYVGPVMELCQERSGDFSNMGISHRTSGLSTDAPRNPDRSLTNSSPDKKLCIMIMNS